jgi:hypothetical protein
VGSSPGNAIDGNASSRWTTGISQANGQWFQVDMGSPNTFYKIVLDATGSAGDYPRGYLVNISNDGINWGSVVTNGSGSSAVTTITFSSPLVARYIRVTQTGSTSGWWSIHEFNVYGTVGTPPPTPTGLTAIAGDGRVVLSWNPTDTATGFNVERSTSSNGIYSVIVSNLPALSFTDTNVTNGTSYFFTVSAVNADGVSGDAGPVNARPVSMTPPQLALGVSAGQMQFNWPSDHTGWRLEAQTNSVGVGLGTNWVTVLNSATTNQIFIPINSTNGSVFFRLIYP